MRHSLFNIGIRERDAWLRNMKSAVDELEIREDLKSELWNYLEMAADAMVNQPRTF
jgi:hemoglobin